MSLSLGRCWKSHSMSPYFPPLPPWGLCFLSVFMCLIPNLAPREGYLLQVALQSGGHMCPQGSEKSYRITESTILGPGDSDAGSLCPALQQGRPGPRGRMGLGGPQVQTINWLQKIQTLHLCLSVESADNPRLPGAQAINIWNLLFFTFIFFLFYFILVRTFNMRSPFLNF